ncbi:Transmembrane_domain-containing protein [Hexamita inflata]|uniref:Transmembrane domain-containing protein n=1 Tax=Hexamita inflata TaxID=28002 RepID=A0AA86R7N5_9EUKA|nr:Transmembrane domain-containing protein [Hexamita inflata]
MVKRQAITKKAEQMAAQTQNTLLDWYQNMMKSIWKKIGVKPDWVHGLDEVTSMFTVASYAIAIIFRMIMTVKSGKITGPAWGPMDSMLCRTDLSVNQAYSYFENGMQWTGSSNVSFLYNSKKPKIVFVIPQRVSPFNQEGYLSIIGAANQIMCQVESSLVENQHVFNFQTEVAFAFGETVEQIKAASSVFETENKLFINLLSQRGFSKLISVDNNYLSKLFCPKCQKSSFASEVERIVSFAKNYELFNQTQFNALEFTLQTFTNHKMSSLDLGVDKNRSETIYPEVIDASAYHFYTQFKDILIQADRFFSNKEITEVFMNYPNVFQSKDNSIVQSITVFGSNISLNASFFYVVAFLITLPLAINLNFMHRKERVKFIKSVTIGFNVRIITFIISTIIIYTVYTLFKQFDKFNSFNIFWYDSDSLFKACACSVVLVSWITMKMEPSFLSMQRNTACLLLIFYLSIAVKSQSSMYLLQVIMFSHLGYWVSDLAQRHGIFSRPWTLNACVIFAYFTFTIALTYANMHLITYNLASLKDQSVILYLLICCLVLSFTLSFFGQMLKLLKGKLVCSVGIIVTFLIYVNLSFANSVENQIIQNLKGNQKVSKLPSSEGFNKIRAFCVNQTCKVHLESGKVQQVEMKDNVIDFFRGNVVVKMGEKLMDSIVDGKTWQQMKVDIESKIFWRGSIEIYTQ